MKICEKGPRFRKLIKTLIEEEVYTSKNRLNKSKLSRMLGWKNKEIDDLFLECQKEICK